jgi:poly(A) polymerase
MKVIKRFLDINSSNYLDILKIIDRAGGHGRVIGGAVRDCLLSVPASDIDIATDLLPSQVLNILSKAAIKVIPTGIAHGTVSAIFHKKSNTSDAQPISPEIIEITTLRKDISCFGRKAHVSFTDSFYEDAARRDFTINALSYCPIKGEIYDYFDGIIDLNNQIVRFIGDAEQRINEDYLRILRFFRFTHRFAKNIDQQALDACITYKEKLRLLSSERIKSEIDLILSASNNQDIMQIMHETGILSIIYPGTNYSLKLQKNLLEAVQFYKCHIDLIRLASYSLIFSSIPTIDIKFLLNFRFSRSEAINILSFIKFRADINQELPMKLNLLYADSSDYPIFFALAEITTGQTAVIREQFTKLQLIEKPIFPVNGHDLKNIASNAKKIGIILINLKEKWAMSNFTLSKENLIKSLNETCSNI